MPYRIYRDDPHYVFPLLDELKHFLDKKKNPFYRHAEPSCGWPATATRSSAASAPAWTATTTSTTTRRWASSASTRWTTTPPPPRALLDTARDWIAGQGMDTMRGPGCFTSNHDWYGLQVDGKFNRPVVGMPYNPRYYEKQFEDFGLTGAKDLFAW